MRKFLKQLFCRHDYEVFKNPFRQYMGISYKVTLICKKCGKVKVVDYSRLF